MAGHFDLLIKGGHVLDPGEGLDGPLDIAIADGRIAALEPDIPPERARRTIQVRGANRRVVPGLIDLHTHTAFGATTPGVGLDCCEPDQVGVRSGVTTLVDTGSVGVTNIGVFGTHLQPRSRTRVLCYVNVGSFALTTARAADVLSLDEVNRDWIGRCIEASPGLISGIKLRVTGPFVLEQGEALISLSKSIAVEHHLPFMAHIGNRMADRARGEQLTRFLLGQQTEGDIITHLCTPHPGGILDRAGKPLDEFVEARSRGVVMDAALGRHNFSFDVARAQADLGIHPDTISTDITPGGYGEIVFSLLECMAKFMALGYSLSDVVRMTTTTPARALGLAEQVGGIAVGREADLTIIDVVSGRWRFTDTLGHEHFGEHALVPVQTLRAGVLIPPNWGPHPWGWLPEAAPHTP
jgi:dihydroorotase